MGTARFDDGTPDNPKLIAAGASASWLWFCGVLYCRRGLTDGFIPSSRLRTLVIGLAHPEKHAQRLVECGLWHVVDGGYQVHDFLDWNPTKAAMAAYRKKDRERKHHGVGIAESVKSNESVQTENDISTRRGYTRAGAKMPLKTTPEIESGDFDLPGESAREGPTTALAPRWSREGRTPSLVGHHEGCWKSAACARGICVPAWLGREWRQQFGDDTPAADAEIAQVIDAALGALPAGPVGDEPKVFWRAVWRAAHGSQAPQAGPSRTKGQLTLEAARRVVLDRLTRAGAVR